jgi:hypothetical protein
MLTGNTTFLCELAVLEGRGARLPTDAGLGVGERGFEKGCARAVDDALGGPSVLGDAVTSGECRGDDVERERIVCIRVGRVDARRRQARQIIVVMIDGRMLILEV